MAKKVVVVDFDGPIHAYSAGWQDGSIYDPPTSGVHKALGTLRGAGYKVIVWSSRCGARVIGGQYQPSQIPQIRAWLQKWEVPYDEVHEGDNKPLASLYIDDRGYRWSDWKFDTRILLSILEDECEKRAD